MRWVMLKILVIFMNKMMSNFVEKQLETILWHKVSIKIKEWQVG